MEEEGRVSGLPALQVRVDDQVEPFACHALLGLGNPTVVLCFLERFGVLHVVQDEVGQGYSVVVVRFNQQWPLRLPGNRRAGSG